MNNQCLLLGLVLAATSSQAADGLSNPPPDALWPQWQARVQLQTSSLLPTESGTALAIKGAALLGDYLLLQPSFGVFRATGGIVSGSLAGVPLYRALPGQTLGVQGSGLQPKLLPVAETPQPLPYLGLGFSTAHLGSGLSVSADFGLVAQSLGSGIDLGRALLGNQGVERAWRELRMSPMAQLSVRYAF